MEKVIHPGIKKGSQGKKGKAVMRRKKYQPFSHESSYHCFESRSRTLVGTRDPDLLTQAAPLDHALPKAKRAAAG